MSKTWGILSRIVSKMDAMEKYNLAALTFAALGSDVNKDATT
jgi:hypothetical protein